MGNTIPLDDIFKRSEPFGVEIKNEDMVYRMICHYAYVSKKRKKVYFATGAWRLDDHPFSAHKLVGKIEEINHPNDDFVNDYRFQTDRPDETVTISVVDHGHWGVDDYLLVNGIEKKKHRRLLLRCFCLNMYRKEFH